MEALIYETTLEIAKRLERGARERFLFERVSQNYQAYKDAKESGDRERIEMRKAALNGVIRAALEIKRS